MAIDGWINKGKVAYGQRMLYYSTMKKKDILPSETQTNLEDILLSEISQAQKDKYSMISVISGMYWWNSQTHKAQE